jgi:hypothetical protein
MILFSSYFSIDIYLGALELYFGQLWVGQIIHDNHAPLFCDPKIKSLIRNDVRMMKLLYVGKVPLEIEH